MIRGTSISNTTPSKQAITPRRVIISEHPEGLWTCAWQLFQQRLPSAEQERAYLMFRRKRDEFWYAERFNLLWPRLQAERFVPSPGEFEALALQASASPSPSPAPKPICSGSNLIKNPGCELAPPAGSNTPPYWTEGAGAESGDWQRKAAGTGFPIPHGGSYFFWAGQSAGAAAVKLYQDVDVSAEATQIDAGRVEFTFSGWLNSNPHPNDHDTAQVIVEYRKADGTILEKYDTGNREDDQWTAYTDVRIAPSGTRTIRITLWARKPSAVGNDIDGYFDDLALTARCGICSGINLIRNPGCELPGEPPPYWSEQSGDWKRQEGGAGSPPFPAAHGGNYFFWAGNSAAGELRQDVDISELATQIDNAEIRLNFSAWLNTYGPGPDTDTSQVVVEFLKADGTPIPFYDSGAKDIDTWTKYGDSKLAPVGVRKVRVTLKAVRNDGTSNDGYFDDISLAVECLFNNTTRNGDRVVSAKDDPLGLPGGIKELDVTAPAGKTVTLTIKTTATGTGTAVFKSTGTATRTVTGTETVTIEGRNVSNAPRDVYVEVKDGASVLGTWDFTVFRVDTTPYYSGTIDDVVAGGQKKLPASAKNFNGKALRDIFLANGSNTLGHTFIGTGPSKESSGEIVFRGMIVPSGMAKSDFNVVHSRFNAFSWNRQIRFRVYDENGDYHPEFRSGGAIQNRMGDHDDKPNDTGSDIEPDSDGIAGDLFIWDQDGPSNIDSFVADDVGAPGSGDGRVARVRENYEEFPMYAGVQAGAMVKWTWASSNTNPAGAVTFAQENTHAAAGDNKVTAAVSPATGGTIILTPDLKASTITAFTVTGGSPNPLKRGQAAQPGSVTGTNLNQGTSKQRLVYLIREVHGDKTTTTTFVPMTETSATATKIEGTWDTTRLVQMPSVTTRL